MEPHFISRPAKKLRPSFLPLMERGPVFHDFSRDESLSPEAIKLPEAQALSAR
jgi:hypothetical protein